MSSKDNLALDLEHGVRRWDRARWISVFSSHNPTIREVTECLGLGLSASSSTTNRGIPKFDNPDYRKLSSEVTKLSKDLPKERDALLDFAADPISLDNHLEELLGHYGPAIWGKDADRSCLLTPDSTKKTYNKDLFYENSEHKEILKVHLHRWIIIKACYYIRNMKLKRPSGASEYDTIAEFDGDGMSPHGTPLSLTPTERDASTGAELEVKPVNFKKRKSSTRGSLSDGEEQAASPAKRAYSTLPISRTGSPRRSLKSLYPAGPGSIENVPPGPTHPHHMSLSPSVGVEPTRVHLSPLANNELNGVARPPGASQSPAPVGFTAVNTGSFTAVNNSPPVREPSREVPRSMSKEPQQASPALHHRDAPSYNSPYDNASRSSATSQGAPDSRVVPPLNTTPGPTIHSPVITSGPNGVGTRESLAVQPVQHTPAPQQPPPQAQPQPVQQIPAPAQHPAQAPVQPQVSLPSHVLSQQPHVQAQQQPPLRPPSRTSTPSTHYSRSLAPHPNSRSSTPHAQAPNQPPHVATNAQVVPPPVVQSAPAYGLQLVPTQQASPAPAPATYVPSNHHIPPPQPYPVHHPPQPVLKSQPVEAAQIVQAPHVATRPTVATTDLRLLQCEVTAGLFTFFYPRSSAPPDEPALLQRLHTLWYHGASLFERDLGPHYDLISKILTAWLHERQAITALRHSLASQPGVSPAGLVDRLLAMNDLRVMRIKWKNMSTVDGLSPEDLLCMAFRVMTNTEGSEYLFKDGLERLNGGVFEFLRNEDAKIVMQRR